MCGIAGAIGPIAPNLVAAVAAASARQRHRGPDDAGEWQSGPVGTRGALFGFRRLAILDLSALGHQPMVDTDTGNAIAFNGEIYNFAELRTELQGRGVVFRSGTDTEVILRGYAHWGRDTIARLRGMFALAIWDARRHRVLVARDRLGIKPLYWTRVAPPGGPPAVAFASELRSLLATGLVERRLQPSALASYLWHGYVAGDASLVDAVQQLPPGHLAEVDPAAPDVVPIRYWQPPRAAPVADGAEQLAAELRTAVRQHLISDVPLGVFLSGGIDSSAVAAMAAEAVGGAAVRTFNVSFDEADFDESSHARAVATALGTQHQEVRVSAAYFRQHLDTALSAIDQPTFDGINTWFVSRATREHGVTVALAGTGGDELFGGYRSFRDVPRSARLARLCRWLPHGLLRTAAAGWVRAMVGRSGAVPPQTRWGKLGDVLCGGGDLLAAYQAAYALFTERFHRELQATPATGLRHGLPEALAERWREATAHQPELHAVGLLELHSFLGERLLRDTDWASMAVSLEVRVPLLDHRVVEAAALVPPNQRFHPLGRKQLLRTLALQRLDPNLFERPKRGFVLPIEAWSRQQLRSEVAATLNDAELCRSLGLAPDAVARLWQAWSSNAPGLYWSRVWTLFVLLRWCREQRVAA
ncbi:MAG: asparagine synthase (glutamine-hydrolyzing) [Planctomycetes bacterium]|nr:asparagine synthase (glutamine-hydrolyzing) [Planctomycetota bacterium]